MACCHTRRLCPSPAELANQLTSATDTQVVDRRALKHRLLAPHRAGSQMASQPDDMELNVSGRRWAICPGPPSAQVQAGGCLDPL